MEPCLCVITCKSSCDADLEGKVNFYTLLIWSIYLEPSYDLYCADILPRTPSLDSPLIALEVSNDPGQSQCATYVNLYEDEDSLQPVKWIQSETIDYVNDGPLSVKVFYTCL